ncbi:MAG: hypothetical protein ABI137_05000 [Antricoccus sp.]
MEILMLKYDTYLATLTKDQQQFIAICARRDPQISVESCPGWTLSDLAVHLGGIWRWATGILLGGRPMSCAVPLARAKRRFGPGVKRTRAQCTSGTRSRQWVWRTPTGLWGRNQSAARWKTTDPSGGAAAALQAPFTP